MPALSPSAPVRPAVPTAATQPAVSTQTTKKVQQQVRKLGIVGSDGVADSALFDEPVLVINQKGKIVELRAEYAVYDQDGRQLAAVRGKRMSSRLQIIDMGGRTLLDLRRDASFVSSKVVVAGPTGAKIGRLVPSVSLGHIDRAFKLEGADNTPIGGVYAEDRSRQRNRQREFNVQDGSGSVVAQISKTRAGLAKEMFTKGDNYIVSIPGPMVDPLRSLTIAAVLVIDATYHQS